MPSLSKTAFIALITLVVSLTSMRLTYGAVPLPRETGDGSGVSYFDPSKPNVLVDPAYLQLQLELGEYAFAILVPILCAQCSILEYVSTRYPEYQSHAILNTISTEYNCRGLDMMTALAGWNTVVQEEAIHTDGLNPNSVSIFQYDLDSFWDLLLEIKMGDFITDAHHTPEYAAYDRGVYDRVLLNFSTTASLDDIQQSQEELRKAWLAYQKVFYAAIASRAELDGGHLTFFNNFVHSFLNIDASNVPAIAQAHYCLYQYVHLFLAARDAQVDVGSSSPFQQLETEMSQVDMSNAVALLELQSKILDHEQGIVFSQKG